MDDSSKFFVEQTSQYDENYSKDGSYLTPVESEEVVRILAQVLRFGVVDLDGDDRHRLLLDVT